MAYAVDLTQASPTRVNISTVGNGPSGSKQENYEMAALGVRIAIAPDSPFTKSGQIEVFKIADNENVAVFDALTGSVDYAGFTGDLDACFEAVKDLLGRRSIAVSMADLTATPSYSTTFDARGMQSVTVGFTLKNCDNTATVGFAISNDNVSFSAVSPVVYGNDGTYSVVAPKANYIQLYFSAQDNPLGNAALDKIIFIGY